jgi:hypothetical protein
MTALVASLDGMGARPPLFSLSPSAIEELPDNNGAESGGEMHTHSTSQGKSAPQNICGVRRFTLGATGAILIIVAAMSLTAQSQTLIPAGSVWRYNDAGGDLGAEWKSPAYVDMAWPLGRTPIGYGNGDEATVVSDGRNVDGRNVTSYFRREFTVPNPAIIPGLTLRFVRDDGIVIYLNGVEVVRSNMPVGSIDHTTFARAVVDSETGLKWHRASLEPGLLVRAPQANWSARRCISRQESKA